MSARHARAGAGLATVGGALLAPATACAHGGGLVDRADVPIPDWLFGWGAAGVLIISFVLLAFFWPKPRLEGDSWRPFKSYFLQAFVTVPAQVIYGAIGVFLLGVTVWSGFAGVQTPAANFAPTFVLIIFWNGLVLVSVLFGDVFRAFNPWRAVARAVAWVAEKAAGTAMPAPMTYPERLGRWPAVAGLLAFAIVELVVEDATLPENLALAALVYSAITWIGMALYGIDAWLDRGEGFSVYFNLFARMSPLEVRDGVLGRRRVLSGLTRWDAQVTGTVALLAVIIGSITYDGFSEGPLFSRWRPDIQSVFVDIGFSPKTGYELTSLVGMIGAILLVFGFYALAILGARSVGGGFGRARLARAFVHSLVPIALVYVAAHYMTQLLFQGQAMAFLASDPLGRGWDLFGGADRGIDYFLSSTPTWYLQVGFVVAGHVAALTLAHDRALVLYSDAKQAVQSQYWMLGVMVGFTSLALWLLSQANS